jgi:uncharacterized protein (TIGR00369 family)
MAEEIDLVLGLQNRLPPFSKLIGVRIISVAPERVVAEMQVTEDLCTSPTILHGGAIMAFADTLGALATVVNLQEGYTTTTIESKTNFFAPALVGTTVTGECTALHRGKRTMAWQTRMTNESGRLMAMVTQTQMVLEPKLKSG